MFTVTNMDHSISELTQLEKREFRRLLGVTFVLFLIIAAVSRLLPRAWRPLSSSAGRSESVYAEAMRAAYTVIPFAFMR